MHTFKINIYCKKMLDLNYSFKALVLTAIIGRFSFSNLFNRTLKNLPCSGLFWTPSPKRFLLFRHFTSGAAFPTKPAPHARLFHDFRRPWQRPRSWVLACLTICQLACFSAPLSNMPPLLLPPLLLPPPPVTSLYIVPLQARSTSRGDWQSWRCARSWVALAQAVF